MSKPRYGWWSFAKFMVRVYPERKSEYEELHSQRVTQNYSQSGKNGTVNRSVENTVAKLLPPAKQAEYEAVKKAIEKTKKLKTGSDRLKLIDMVFWKQSHTLEGAAYAMFVSDTTARRWHRDFIRLVGFCRGLADVDDDAA